MTFCSTTNTSEEYERTQQGNLLGHLGRGADNQNGNLRWYLPLGVDPPPSIFLPYFFSFAIESYIYETDFTLQKYHFEVLL